MNTQQLLGELAAELKAGRISKSEVLALVAEPSEANNSARIIHIMYAIGAIIILLGVVILISTNWEYLGLSARLLVTMGISVAAYVAAMVMRAPHQKTLSDVFFTISAVLAPIGAFVLIDGAHIDISWRAHAVAAGIIAVLYAVALVLSKRNILLLYTLAFVSWAYYALVWGISDGALSIGNDVFKIATIILGATYILLGQWYRNGSLKNEESQHKASVILNCILGVGTIGVLG
jgi:uncharacterized membrane protein